MSAPQGWEIGTAWLEPPAAAINRRKASVKILRTPPLWILPLILKKSILRDGIDLGIWKF